jgi:hypothetical protein
MIKRYREYKGCRTSMNQISEEDKEGCWVKYDNHLKEIEKIKQAINNYLKECEDKKFDAYHNGYEFEDLELKINILNTKKILKIIEGVE